MIKVLLICTYCGHTWKDEIFTQADLEYKICKNGYCKEKNLIIKDLSKEIDPYQGCPPFPKKKIEYW